MPLPGFTKRRCPTQEMFVFELASGLDPKRLAEIYREFHRLQIRNFLSDESARNLHRELADSAEWRLTVNRGEEIRHFSLDHLSAWTDEQHALLERAVTFGGRYGFQFRYEVIRLESTTGEMLLAFRDFLSSPEVVELMREITGVDDISFADAHASRYQPGHFLTAHDDHQESMRRKAAYVLNLTPEWRPDWGGLLQFYDASGNVSRAFTPGFNVLNIFRVPQTHSVSWVTPIAAAPRYAVTGWLRAGEAADD